MIRVEAHIVSYNSRAVLGDCLGSLLQWTPTNPDIEFGIAVLDNASTDLTADLVAEEFPEVRLTRRQTNVLYGPASNQLVAQSEADHVLVINPDTVIDSDVVTPLVAALEAHPDAALACPTITDADGGLQPFIQHFPTLSYEAALLFRGSKLGEFLRAWWDADELVHRNRDELPPSGTTFSMRFVWSTAWLIRTSVARRFPFSADFPMYDTDVDVCRRMARQGLGAVYVDEVAVRHIGGASSDPMRKRRMQHSARADYYRVHHGRGHELAYRALQDVWPRLVAAKRRIR